MEFRPFAEAKEFVHTLGLKSAREREVYCKSGKKPPDIPSNPSRRYINEWNGYGDWLGTAKPNRVTQRSYKSFDKARGYIRTLGLKDGKYDWREYCKSGKKPDDIPSDPDGTYEKEWKRWGDWLGTGYVATFNRQYLSFPEAREFVHTLGLRSQSEWQAYVTSGKKPDDIPSDKLFI